MQICVLGPLELSVDDHPVALGGTKQRAVLAMLGLDANHAVTADRLIEGLWGEEPPASAAKMVQNYVWRLRGALPAGAGAEIVTRGRSYELRIDRELVDVCRLERLVSEAARGGSADAAREALALFRGEPLSDVAGEPFANAEIRRLEELRLTASELAVEADLADGRHQDVVLEIEALLAANPLRERLHAQRMLALYRCGRQAEALEAFRHARATLVEQIGVEPAPELRRLHDAILRQDPSLDVEPAAAELPRELDLTASPPLIGRDPQLRRIRACWQRAGAGAGALVTVAGAYGMGKTRLAAEIAGDAQREGADVRYIAGTGPSEAVLAVLARTREARRPSLLVVDDADRAAADVRAALRELGGALSRLPALVLATGLQAAALERLEPAESLVLEPLDARSVRAIAGLYAPSGSDGAVPVEALLATSGGVPRRVHQAAGEWARQEAMRRVDEAAGRAASDRSEARASETALADSVAELQSARELAEVAGAPVVCPYKGLATFEREDVEYFFGRERLVAELVARLVGGKLLTVVGPSGSGKSSVVRAGLLPALAGGVLPGSDTWTQAVMRPGSQPLRELRRVNRKLAREWRSVLAIDQFEELFTACEDERERREFVAALVHAARDDARVVVLVIRADFYGRCAAYPELSRLLGADHVLVGPMSREELRCAIERPARRVGLSVDPELADALLADVEGRPGALPLLSTALLELWRERDGRRLRLAAYARSGGVEGAVARLAEDAYVQLDPRQQAAARALMLRLADEDESGAIVRRRIPLSEVDAGVVAALAEQRLLTVGDGAVEVAHEALLREWPRLRGWLEEDVQGRHVQRRLGAAARAWDADARDPGALYRGVRLASALDWAGEHDPELNATERAFLDAGRRASGRAQRRLRMTLAAVASLLVLAVIAGVVALDQRHTARASATAADAQRLGAQALVDDDLDRGLLLARQGVALHDSQQTRGNLFAALLRSPAAIGVLHGDRLSGVELSPDGRTVVFTDAAGRLHFVDARSRRPLAAPQVVPGLVPGLVGDLLQFSDDGTWLAAGGSQPAILDARTHRVAARLAVDGVTAERLIFSPDGRTLFAAVGYGDPVRAGLERFDVRSGRSLGPLVDLGRRNAPAAMALTHDGRLITSVDGSPAVIRDARTLLPLAHLPAGGTEMALGPDDRTLLLGDRDGTVRFADLATGTVRVASGRQDGAVVGIAFSADGRTAVTAAEDNRALVWDVARAAARETLTGHGGQITGMAIARDGRTLYTSSLDGKVLIWDLAGDRRLGRPFSTGAPSAVPDFPLVSSALSPDGADLAFGHADGTVSVVDARTLQARASFRAVPSGIVGVLAYMPGGRLLLVTSNDGYVALVDPAGGRLVRRLPDGLSAQETRIEGSLTPAPPSFSADGRLMALANGDDVALWTLENGRPVGRPRAYYASIFARSAVLSPDGRTVAVVSPVGVAIVDVATLGRRALLPRAASAEFTPDGRYLATGGPDGSSQLWSTRTWRAVGRPLAGHTGDVYWQSVSPDGRTLATGSLDGTVRLYDVGTQSPLGGPLPGVPNHATAPQFTPDGAHLFAITNAGSAVRWDVRPAAWARHACAVAGRTLTRAEWSSALPGRDYAPACGA